MSVYSVISEIFSAGSADISEVGVALESDLPTLHDSASDTALVSASTTGFTTIDTLAGLVVKGNELVVLVSMVSVSASNTSDVWQLTHSLDGTYKGTSEYAFYTAPISNSTGRQQAITVFTVWKDQTAGTLNATLGVAPQSAPAGTFYARPYATHAFRFKRR